MLVTLDAPAWPGATYTPVRLELTLTADDLARIAVPGATHGTIADKALPAVLDFFAAHDR